jgi:hypothetical protein
MMNQMVKRAEITVSSETVAAIQAQLEKLAGFQWQPIATAPHDRPIVVYAPPREDLPEFAGVCEWHPDAAFCVCELREVTHWMEKP